MPRRPIKSDESPQAISLFAGAGGLDIGLEKAGWDVVAATDIDPDCVQTLTESKDAGIRIGRSRKTFLQDTALIEANVLELTARDLKPAGAPRNWRPALVAGGPPCQPWSSAGHQKGLNDPRGQVIQHMIRLVDELKPTFVLLENVRGLVTAVGSNGRPGEVLQGIQSDLNDIGYASRIATLNAADFGAAQRRVRLVLIATNTHALPEFPIPSHDRHGAKGGSKPWVTLGDFLAAMPPTESDEIVVPTGVRAAELQALTPGTGIRTGGRVENNRPSGHWGYRQDSFLADLSRPSRTIRAATTPDWIRLAGEPMRRLTAKECAALQGFPVEWRFAGTSASRFRQIGNAVQGDMAWALGCELRETWQLGSAKEAPITPPWPADLLKRVSYTVAEHKVNGEHRIRIKTRSALSA